jgi:glucuronosyltransferase
MDKFEKALHNVLEIPSYKKNMKLRSKRFRDQPEKPINRALWHIEYIMRHPDAVEYLSSPTTKLGFIKSNSIDVYLGFAVILFILVSLSYKICQCIVSYCNKNKNVKTKSD